MTDSDVKIKIHAQNTATPALTELLNSIKALIEQARILNTLLNLHINVSGSGNNLGADLHALELQAQQLQNHLNLQINAQNNAGGALNSATQSTQQLGTAAHGAAGGVRSLEQQAEVLQTRLNQFIALQVAQVVTGWGQSLVTTAEAYQTNSAKLHIAIKDTHEFNAVHKALFDIAQRSRGSLDQTTNAFIRNSESIKRMGGTTEQALLSTELLNKAIASTSMGAAQDASALMQWNQALGKGILNGDELNSIMENSLGLTKAIADGMGIPIGKLKELGEQGKLTGTDLVNALFANRQSIEQNFNAIPVTISQSLTAVENAFQQYIGQTNEASGATQGIAKTILEASKGLPDIIEGLTALAGIYGVKLTSSLVAYIAQLRIQSAANAEAIAETERLNYVRIQELETQQAVTAASVTAARSKLAEARLDATLATTVADRTAANEALALSITQVTAAEERYIGATAALGAATDTAAVSMTRMEIVAQGLKTTFSGLFAAWAGWEVGTFLRKFESVRNAGSLVVEGFVIQMETVKHFFSGAFLTSEQGLADKIKAIHKDFADSRAADSADAQNNAEQAKARSEAELERVKLEKIVKQEAFKEIQNQLKETGAATDSETARQSAASKAALEQEKADIAASAGTVLQKELLVAQAVKASQDAQLLITKQAAMDKLAVTDKVYVAELQKLKDGTVEQKTVLKESLTARLGIYQELEKSYNGTITGLIAEEQRLATESQRLANERRGIEQSYADFKRGLDNIGKSDYQKITNEKAQLDALIAEQKKALAAGDLAAAELLNTRILELGKDLALKQKADMETGQKNISEAHKKGLDKRHEMFTTVSQSDIDATLRITDKAQSDILKVNKAAQDSNKDRFADVKSSAENAKTELGKVQTEIANITQALQKDFAFKVTSNIGSVLADKERLKEPTSSTHTEYVKRVEDHATGGLISAYATGGEVFQRKQGAISGKGTGTSDEIPAMLSNGEYVITADKVNQYGKGVFDAINYGSQPVAIAHYANGGAVGDDRKNKIIADIENKQFEEFEKLANLPFTQISWSGASGSNLYMSPANRKTAENNFAGSARKYLNEHRLPSEFLTRYFNRLKLAKTATDATKSMDERASAQMAIEDSVSAPANAQSTRLDRSASAPPPAQPTSVAPPVLSAPPPVLSNPVGFPVIPPPAFTPSASSQSQSVQTGKVHTLKIENQNGKTVTAHTQEPNLDQFFDELGVVSGVSRL